MAPVRDRHGHAGIRRQLLGKRRVMWLALMTRCNDDRLKAIFRAVAKTHRPAIADRTDSRDIRTEANGLAQIKLIGISIQIRRHLRVIGIDRCIWRKRKIP